ncbi:aminotransferase, class V [Thermogladius calderae 1633]|uniref:Aminotransferase, class V n=1 Tax=Thermogladius calderae (strain DSM 22663 / VKM B-2946 / 1633) TaxID=1184251 RepID=I3TCN8_THEC1|nr:alanine--glyoxylate aminotransferase family protein [Thermogladius calderae]AFK50526.1 aminotransferase, class V [Thermogladius calderae 1633]
MYLDVVREVEQLVWPRKMRLFTAGPVACFPEVLEAMKFQMFSHRSKEYQELHKDATLRLKKFLEADKATVLLIPSSGTGFMEASVRNAISPRGKVLVTVIGEFGNRYKETVERNGRVPVVLEEELGKAVKPEELDDALKKNPDVEAVTITYNETSTGVLNPLRELAKVAKEHGKLVFVDAVSAMGAADIKVDAWGIDLVFASSQKAFGLPPGLAMAAVSEEVFERARKIPERGLYFDLLEIREFLEKQWSTPTTPPISIIIGLDVMLRIIDRMGGKDAWLKMYAERAETIRRRVLEFGLELFAEPGYYSPTITVVYNPPGIKGPVIYEELRKRGIEIAKGYGKVRDITFRIGHMGYITQEDIEELFRNLKEVLASLGFAKR